MRRPDWQRQLITTLEAARVRPFVWGELDCCLFVADCCVATCGVDPAAVYRGRYTTAIGSQRVLTKEHGSIAAVLDVHFQRIDPALAQRGDPVVFDGPLGQTAGLMWAGQVWAMTEQGARPVPDAVPLFAWRAE